MRTIAVLQQKGGVGKTTLATNLGAAAYLDGKKTLILDFDRQGSAFDWYKARKDTSKIAGLVVTMASKALTHDKLKAITSPYDVAIFDGPARLEEMTRAAALAADIVLIPVRPSSLDFWATEETLQQLDAADKERSEKFGKKRVKRIFVINGAPARAKITESIREQLVKYGTVVPVTIGNRVAFAMAMQEGESVLSFGRTSPAAEEIRALYQTITGRGVAKSTVKKTETTQQEKAA